VRSQEKEVEKLVDPVRDILTPRDRDSPEAFRSVTRADDRYQLRAISFAPERPQARKSQTRHVHGAETSGLIDSCLRTQSLRKNGTTRYDFGLWGDLFEPSVRLIKSSERLVTIDDIYQALLDAEGAVTLPR
jgi:hypothetical protein